MRLSIQLLILFAAFTFINEAAAQTGSVNEPVRYVGGVSIDPWMHEGRLRYAVGVENRQTFRANKTNPEWSDGYGWTYSHASNLAYWKGKFYQQYLSNPVDEHISPGQTLLLTSENGKDWSLPEVIFPPYQAPAQVEIPAGYEGYMMHQRMGFYVAPNDRLLTLAFYAHSEDPFKEGGIGRVVREIYEDGTKGPIYFIRYSSHTNWNETNTSYPFYTSATDQGFIAACDSLLADHLVTLQWWDEDRGLDNFYSIDTAGQAISYYQRADGNLVALWKWGFAGLSFDGGKTFSNPVKVPTLVMDGGKVWGQATEDSRYAISYNPINNSEYRYPMIVITSDDGIIYDDMALIQGEVPPRRFYGRWKDFGPCYMRGIVPGNGDPPGDDMWLSYSMNKEDIWISRIPVPIKLSIEGNVDDDFNSLKPSGAIDDWNIYAPLWAPVKVVKDQGENQVLELRDKDPYDYARAIRVIEEGNNKNISFRVKTDQNNHGMLEIDIADRYGNRPVSIRFDSEGKLLGSRGSEMVELLNYAKDRWYQLKIIIDATLNGSYQLIIDDEVKLTNAPLSVAVKSVERVSFRTGPYRELPHRNTPNETPHPPLPGADEPVPEAVFYLDDFICD